MSSGREFFEKAAEATTTYKACLRVNATGAAEYFRQRAIWFVAQGVMAAAREMQKDGKEGKQASGSSYGEIKSADEPAALDTGALSAAAYGDGR